MPSRQKKPIEEAFLKVFQGVRKKLSFTTFPLKELKDHLIEVLAQAAISKCVAFNIAANQKIKHTEAAFFLMSNLRGICEDLICLTYLSRLEKKHAVKLIELKQFQNVSKGLKVQKNFFEANNPVQPIFNDREITGRAERIIQQNREDLRDLWQSMGCFKQDGPTTRDMAESVGLTSTYEFVYFSASNFVHFNPQALFRMGWGPQEGPFTFSVRHMDSYYRSFSSFYGAVLFIGFHSSFGRHCFEADLNAEIKELIELLGHVHRWPEVITFEEMNHKPPLYILTHALREAMREEDKKMPYGAILEEVQSLRASTP